MEMAEVAKKTPGSETNQEKPCQQQIIEKITKINGETCQRVYERANFLGRGGFATCFKIIHQESQKSFATKIIPKKLLQSFRTKLRLANEIKLHKSLHHENIVRFHNSFEDQDNMYINLQLCENGALSDFLRAREFLTTPEVQSLIYGICQGVKYLHTNKIIHRDLKLGNIFLDDKFMVKLGDFGLATKSQFKNQYKRTVCGTPNYIAPQILEGKGYYYEVDIWAIGIILYTLYYIVPPFESQDSKSTYELIRKCEVNIPKFKQVPVEANDLIRSILIKSPANRPSINEILECPFMKLGTSIPIGLPASSDLRAPNKKQLANWPSVPTGRPLRKSSKKFTMPFTMSYRNLPKLSIDNTKISSLKQLQVKPAESELRIISTEEVGENLELFVLNNGVYGLFEKDSRVIYSRKYSEKTAIRRIDSKLSHSELISQFQCPHRVLLGLKGLEISSKVEFTNWFSRYEQKDQSQHDLVVLNQFKQILMARFSDRKIQLIFKQKDSFVISSDRQQITYFCNSLDDQSLLVFQTAILTDSEASTQIRKLKQKKSSKITDRKLAYLKGLLQAQGKLCKQNIKE